MKTVAIIRGIDGKHCVFLNKIVKGKTYTICLSTHDSGNEALSHGRKIAKFCGWAYGSFDFD